MPVFDRPPLLQISTNSVIELAVDLAVGSINLFLCYNTNMRLEFGYLTTFYIVSLKMPGRDSVLCRPCYRRHFSQMLLYIVSPNQLHSVRLKVQKLINMQ